MRNEGARGARANTVFVSLTFLCQADGEQLVEYVAMGFARVPSADRGGAMINLYLVPLFCILLSRALSSSVTHLSCVYRPCFDQAPSLQPRNVDSPQPASLLSPLVCVQHAYLEKRKVAHHSPASHAAKS